MKDKKTNILLEKYCNVFAEKVSQAYFKQHAKVESKDVMQVQPIRQVNLFVVKNLYDNWQRESDKLRSPYFNFAHPNIQEALQVFMNTLSHHVSLEHTTYAALLQKSAMETLSLIFQPYDYYHGLLKEYETDAVPVDYLKYVAKYIKTNGYILHHMLNVLEEHQMPEIPREKYQWLLDLAINRTTESPEDVDQFLKDFSEVLPLKLEDIYGENTENTRPSFDAPPDEPYYSQEEVEDSEEDELEDVSDELIPDYPEITIATPPATLFETGDENPRQAKDSSPTAEDDTNDRSQKSEENTQQDNGSAPADPSNEPPESVTDEVTFPEVHLKFNDDHKRSSKDLAKAFATRVDYSFDTPEKSILNDILSHEQGESLADMHRNSKIQSIQKSISINQRFMFIKNLFQGDEHAFERTLAHLESVASAEEAESFLTHKYGQWDPNSEEVTEFIQLIRRRFAE